MYHKNTLALNHNAICQAEAEHYRFEWFAVFIINVIENVFRFVQFVHAYQFHVYCDVTMSQLCRRAKDSEFRSCAMPGLRWDPRTQIWIQAAGLGVCDSIIFMSCFFDLYILLWCLAWCVFFTLFDVSFMSTGGLAVYFQNILTGNLLMKRLCSTRK